MKGFIIIFAVFMSFAANAARVECKSAEVTIIVQSTDTLKVTFLGETVPADGILTSEEVDLIAKFKSIGEMTLFAKVGKESPESYAFINGKRISVLCR
jgi:hypothetical protein